MNIKKLANSIVADSKKDLIDEYFPNWQQLMKKQPMD
jgi:hypothetical protein